MQRTIAPVDALKTLSAPAHLTADARRLLNPNLNLTVSFRKNSSGRVASPIDHL